MARGIRQTLKAAVNRTNNPRQVAADTRADEKREQRERQERQHEIGIRFDQRHHVCDADCADPCLIKR